MAGRAYMGIPRDKLPWCPRIDPEKCIGCGACMETCPNSVYIMKEESGKVEVAEPDNCVVLCDKCAGFCPQDAISFPDKEEMKRLIGRLLREMKEPQNEPNT
jgi:NAD-dependent dihydropyrimidine dehydrogenase PreA subunit